MQQIIYILVFMLSSTSLFCSGIFPDEVDETVSLNQRTRISLNGVRYLAIWRHDPSEPNNPMKRKLYKYIYFNKEKQPVQITQNDIGGNTIRIEQRKYNAKGEIMAISVKTPTDTNVIKFSYKYTSKGKIKAAEETTYLNDSLISFSTKIIEYDSLGRRTEISEYNQWDSLISQRSFVYTNSYNPEKEIIPIDEQRRISYEYEYDAYGQYLSKTLIENNQCNTSWNFEYDDNKKLTRKCALMHCKIPFECTYYHYEGDNITLCEIFRSQNPIRAEYEYNDKGLIITARFYRLDDDYEELQYYDDIYSINYRYYKK